jgi:hypothetical protein
MKLSLRRVLQSDFVITKVAGGIGDDILINAKRRFHKADEPTFFSKWVTKKYAQRVFSEAGKQFQIDY